MQEYLWDGIKRDRMAWVGDMHPEVRTINAVFGFDETVPHSLDLMSASTLPQHWMNGISTYSLWWIIIQAEWYWQHGDLEFLRRHRGYLDGLVRHLRGFLAGGCAGLSAFYVYYVLEALADAGKHNAALKMIRDYWGGMLDLGATTFWEEFDLQWAEGAHAIHMTVLPGQDRRPARCADGIAAVTVVQTHSAMGKPINVRCRSDRRKCAAIGADRIRGMVVGHGVENVGLS